MKNSTDPRSTWQLGLSLLMVNPFIALPLVFTDPPQWVQIAAVVVIIVLVATGSTLMRRRTGGWRPTETLPGPHSDDH